MKARLKVTERMLQRLLQHGIRLRCTCAVGSKYTVFPDWIIEIV